MDVGQILIGCGLGAVLVAVINAFVQKRKLGADTAQVLSKTALELVQPLRDRIHELEDEVVALRAQVREATTELRSCRQLRAGRRGGSTA
jgi:type II secretory pathway component PulM